MNSWFLSTISPWPLLLGVVLLLIGVTTLYLAWRQAERNWLLISLGWMLLLAAHWPLGLALRFDRAWALAAILPGFFALLWLAATTPWQHWDSQGRQRPVRESVVTKTNASMSTPSTSLSLTGNVFGQILVVGLLSFCAAVGAALALFSALETSIVNRTVYAALLVLLLWPVLIVWSKAKAALLKPALYFIGASIAGLLFTPVLF